MLKRIISAAIAIPFGVFIIIFDHLYLLSAVVSMLSIIAVYEMLLATKYLKNRLITILSLTFVAVFPFSLSIPIFRNNLPIFFGVFIISLLLVMLFMHEKVKLEQISLIAFISITFPLSLSCILLVRINYNLHGIYYILFILFAAWFGDAGAYFVGTFIGKHKMAPKISPNKTWEGFFGGIILSALLCLLSAVIYENISSSTFEVSKVYLTIIALICAVLGVVGDLLASIIKRQCAVKDFGNIMPGHGGILDRFDSVLLVAPFVYHAFKIFPPIEEISVSIGIGLA